MPFECDRCGEDLMGLEEFGSSHHVPIQLQGGEAATGETPEYFANGRQTLCAACFMQHVYEPSDDLPAESWAGPIAENH